MKNEYDEKNLEQVNKIVDGVEKVVEVGIIYKIASVAIVALPLFTLVLIFSTVAHGIMSINTAFTVARCVFLLIAVFNVVLFIINRVKKNYTHSMRDNIFFVLSFIYVFVVIYITFFIPFKFINYSKREYVNVGGAEIPTLYKYTEHSGALVSLKTSQQTEIGDESNKVNCNVEFIYIVFNDKNRISDEEAEKYANEMEKNGYTKVITHDEEGNLRLICYIYNEAENYMIYSTCDNYSVMYSKLTSDEKLPNIDHLMESEQLKLK